MNIENRVKLLETNFIQLRIDIAEIKATLPALAKQEDLAPIRAQLPYFATHADISKLIMWSAGIGVTSLISITFAVLNYLK